MVSRPEGWLLVVGVAIVGAAVGILAGLLLGDRIAGAVTGVVLAVLGVFGARGRALVDRGRVAGPSARRPPPTRR
jgi:hypothetical protein